MGYSGWVPYMTADETAARYRITVKGLLKQRSEGRLPGSLGKRVGKRVLWASEELDVFDAMEDGSNTIYAPPESFGALHALVLETRGVNKRLDKLLAAVEADRTATVRTGKLLERIADRLDRMTRPLLPPEEAADE